LPIAAFKEADYQTQMNDYMNYLGNNQGRERTLCMDDRGALGAGLGSFGGPAGATAGAEISVPDLATLTAISTNREFMALNFDPSAYLAAFKSGTSEEQIRRIKIIAQGMQGIGKESRICPVFPSNKSKAEWQQVMDYIKLKMRAEILTR